MRLFRPVSILIALVLACGLSLVSTSPAQAKEPHDVENVKAGEVRNTGKFFVKGIARTYRRKVVKLQRARKGSRNYRTIKGDRTNREGRFYMRFDGPRGTCYRIVVPGTTRYAKYTQRVGCIVAQ